MAPKDLGSPKKMNKESENCYSVCQSSPNGGSPNVLVVQNNPNGDSSNIIVVPMAIVCMSLLSKIVQTAIVHTAIVQMSL